MVTVSRFNKRTAIALTVLHSQVSSRKYSSAITLMDKPVSPKEELV
jgi:hypothetical protein